MSHVNRKLFSSLPFLGFAIWCGCQRAGPEGPDAIPVEGKIVFVRGGDPEALNGCQAMIELQSVEHPDVLAAGEIREDGSFELTTLEDGITREGVIEGKHRVRLHVDESAEHLVAPRFRDFDTSGIVVQVPSSDPIEVKVWR